MSRNNFQSILRYIRLDDKNSRPIRRRTDKFATIRELRNSGIDNCQKSYFLYADVAVDEQRFPFQSSLVRVFGKQFIIIIALRICSFLSIFLQNQLEISNINLCSVQMIFFIQNNFYNATFNF